MQNKKMNSASEMNFSVITFLNLRREQISKLNLGKIYDSILRVYFVITRHKETQESFPPVLTSTMIIYLSSPINLLPP